MKNQSGQQSGKTSFWQRWLFPKRLPTLFAVRLQLPLGAIQRTTQRAPAQIHRPAAGRGRCLLCVIIDSDAASILRKAVMQNSGVVFMRLQQMAHQPQLQVWLCLESWARQQTLTAIMAVLPRAEFRF